MEIYLNLCANLFNRGCYIRTVLLYSKGLFFLFGHGMEIPQVIFIGTNYSHFYTNSYYPGFHLIR